MNKLIKAIALILIVGIGLCGCEKSDNTKKPNNESRNYSETLRVYNAADYIDRATIADFEKEFKIRVIYDEFESNEIMYEEIVDSPDSYDVLVPSDYMIDRLIKEGRLEKLNIGKIPNISNVAPLYLSPDYDPNNDYIVPYMVGTLGILYNKRLVKDPVDSWEALWDPKYKGEILMWDSMRDCLGAAMKMLGFSMNTNDNAELAKVKERLLAQRPLVKAYMEEDIRDIMIADEATLALIYSGEAKTAIDQNPNLAYVIPKEGANKWVDGFVILKNTKHLDAAEKFIDFMCRPNIAIRNMTETGYTSPIPGAWAEFGENTIMFPTEEELDRCEAFLYNAEAIQKYDRLWYDVRGGH